MDHMFYNAKSFDGDLSKWDVSKVANMNNMFAGAKAFSQTLCGAWQKSTASGKGKMFTGSSGKIMCTATTTTPKVFAPKAKTELRAAIAACMKASDFVCTKGPHGPIGSWDVSAVTVMSFLLSKISGADKFNGDISKWDVSRVTSMVYMFYQATSFNGDISKWDVSSVTDKMGAMFAGASSFNGDISKWDVSKVTNMESMFQNAGSFNGDLSKWDVSKVTNMYAMFQVFSNAKAFKGGDLSKWDVSSVTNMNNMFQGASSFNGDISKWDVSKVTTMFYMFYGASSFNSDLSKWDVSKVTNMRFMFYGVKSFNGDLSKWDVSKVTEMGQMFTSAKAFSQTLCGAWVKSTANGKGKMFTGSSGKIMCTTTTTTPKVFAAKSKAALQAAIAACMKASDFVCTKGPHGPIGSWDVSAVTVMSFLFKI